ncbi:MAG: 6,7-dimethyl-8-ribityllumazine synthase [Rikenellaceae bacterium]
MATKNNNLSNVGELPSAEGMRFGIVVAEWNSEITFALMEGAKATFIAAGAKEEDIVVSYVPGAFELPLGAKYQLKYSNVDAVVVLGCVIQGDTRHFDYICDGTTQGVMDLMLHDKRPIGFGLLTVNDMQQALDRCGGVHGNKGDEAAATVLKMVHLRQTLIDSQIEK